LGDATVSAPTASAAFEMKLAPGPAAKAAAAMVESLRKRRLVRWGIAENLMAGEWCVIVF